ncbi:MAG: outer membrane beta-barrel domain-containing protein [Bdellovibrionaceae bacterium]|nr:outer membrane beta-barrel domain-containing protein [Pseudobdellovibrionaceae bacterium]
MKHLILSIFSVALITPILVFAQAKKDLKNEVSTLGDNHDVVERVKNMDTNQRVRVVQNRLVNRNNRIELGANYSYNGGGDSYVKSQNVGASLEYHLNPRWSFGIHYQKSYNTLTPEGENQFEIAQADQKVNQGSTKRFPSVDYPLETQLATVSYYPIYGKMNLFDTGIAQFDLYLQLGYGQMNLFSGSSDVYSVGVGSGIWLTQRITTRIEARYQQYQDLVQSERRKQNNLQALASIGFLVW